MMPTGFVAEIMVESHDAMHLGTRQIERVSDDRYRVAADKTVFFLQCVQNREHRAFEP